VQKPLARSGSEEKTKHKTVESIGIAQAKPPSSADNSSTANPSTSAQEHKPGTADQGSAQSSTKDETHSLGTEGLPSQSATKKDENLDLERKLSPERDEKVNTEDKLPLDRAPAAPSSDSRDSKLATAHQDVGKSTQGGASSEKLDTLHQDSGKAIPDESASSEKLGTIDQESKAPASSERLGTAHQDSEQRRRDEGTSAEPLGPVPQEPNREPVSLEKTTEKTGTTKEITTGDARDTNKDGHVSLGEKIKGVFHRNRQNA
jgi:hypothetical protein